MRVACYERVSTQEQGLKGLSIDAQISALEEWAASHTIVGHYTDIGVSGRRPHNKRPEMVRLLKDVEAGLIDLIIFVRLDRWFRSVKEYYKVQDVLDRNKVAWRAVQEDYETQTASGRFKVNIMLSVAQDEAERTGERIKAVNEFKRSKGEFCSGNVGLGLTLKDKKLAPSEDAWKVKEIFNAYISTGSVYGAQNLLEKQGIRIGDRSLRYIIDNENYVETGVIPRDTWEHVRELRRTPRPRTTNQKRTYLFNGILFCSCGHRMTGMFSGGFFYYRCPGNYQERTCPVKSMIREDRLEDELIKRLLPECEKINWLVRKKKGKTPDPDGIKRKMDKLLTLYMDDLIGRDKYERDYRQLQAELKEAELLQNPVDMETMMTTLQLYGSLSREAKRAFWYNIIKRIDIENDTPKFTLILHPVIDHIVSGAL